MFKWYGLLGILFLVLAELNFIFKIEPFASWYFPIIWIGYILVIDALVYKVRKRSLLSNKPFELGGMFIISAFLWWIFELVNIRITNWSYTGIEHIVKTGALVGFKFIAFATVLPALFETTELIRCLKLFENEKLKKTHKITKKVIGAMVCSGIACFFLPLIFPTFAFPLIWLSFFLILDPINYLHGQPSIIRHLKDKKIAIPLSLLLAGIILGVLWEFWNYWAITKWTYSIPYVGFFKIFEMPILGYLGYFPFAFELYAMYWFVRSLFVQQERLLR